MGRKAGTIVMNLENELRNLKQSLDDLRKRWPAHSVKPELVEEMERLEDAIARLEKQLSSMDSESPGSDDHL